MNPWKIIGWIVLVIMILGLTFCGLVCVRVAENHSSGTSSSSTSSSSATPAPDYQVKVISVDCRGDYGRDHAQVTIQNTGNTAIPYAKAFVQFKAKNGTVVSAGDSYFRPTTVPPGAQASATVYSSGGSADSCVPSAIQDGDGNLVRIQ